MFRDTSSPPPRRGLERARFPLALLAEPLKEPGDPVQVEVHHIRQGELEPAATVLVVEQPEDALPQLIGLDDREQAIYGAAFAVFPALAVGRKNPRSKGSWTSWIPRQVGHSTSMVVSTPPSAWSN